MPGAISPILPIPFPEPARLTGAAARGAFGDVLASAIQNVEGTSQAAGAAVGRFLSGEGEEFHTAALAVQRAELSFDLFLQARNKVVSAYQEIMRMQM